MTGAKFQEEIDYVGAGLAPLRLARVYLSTGFVAQSTGAPPIYPLGYHWMHSYERSLEITAAANVPHTLIIRRPEPAPAYFYFDGVNYASSVSSKDVLTQIPGSGGAISGWRWNRADGSTEIYDVLGRIVEIRKRDVLQATMVYDGTGKLTEVRDPFLRTLTFNYDGMGQLSSVGLPGGGQVVLTTSQPENLATALPQDAGVEPFNRLQIASVAYPGGATRSYLYGEAGLVPSNSASMLMLMTGIVTESGSRLSTYKYEGAQATIPV